MQVVTQSQQLEQMNAKLRQAEADAASARARMADLEARMVNGGIAVPHGGMQAGAMDHGAPVPGSSQKTLNSDASKRGTQGHAGTSPGQDVVTQRDFWGNADPAQNSPQASTETTCVVLPDVSSMHR